MSDSCRVGEPCPACGRADLRPYGNGSKWLCPACFFLMPCCEGGELRPNPSGGARTPAGRVAAR